MKIFILAAGFGQRLHPLTTHLPKPLLPILGIPILDLIMQRLYDFFPDAPVGMNSHYHSAALQNWIKSSLFADQVTLFTENPILGTGGALENARKFLKDDSFIVHNSDIISEMDLSQLMEIHQRENNLVTLAVHHQDNARYVGLDKNQRLICIGQEQPLAGVQEWVGFTGVAIYHPRFLKYLPSGFSKTTQAWLNAVAKGEKIGTYSIGQSCWQDLGNIDAFIFENVRQLLSRNITRFIHPQVHLPSDLRLQEMIIINQEAEISPHCQLKNVIIMPGAKINESAVLNHKLVGPDYTIDFSHLNFTQIQSNTVKKIYPRTVLFRPLLLNHSEPVSASLVGGGGSDRQYYRLPGLNRILMIYHRHLDPLEVRRHIEYTVFFQKHNLPVPALINYNFKNCQIIFEDLGELDLHQWMKKNPAPEEIKALYKKILLCFVQLHSLPAQDCPLLYEWHFNLETLLWETHYFLQRCVKSIFKLSIENEIEIEKELKSLAQTVDRFPKRVMHRDFQSQNIMLKGEAPFFIDFQGARMGPPAYDIASLLRDPYSPLSDSVRTELIDFYKNQISQKQPEILENFDESLILCGLQRHMQALGAYGFLSKIKGKPAFLQFIPEALRHLSFEINRVRERFPCLFQLVQKLTEKTDLPSLP